LRMPAPVAPRMAPIISRLSAGGWSRG